MSKNEKKASLPRTRVLIVGMLDSVHLARWLGQFRNEEIDFVIFGSKKYKNLHPQLTELLDSNQGARYGLAFCPLARSASGYLDFLVFELGKRLYFFKNRVRFLESLLESESFQFVHALEIQGAGYLINEIRMELLTKQKVIVTNWGSDIFFYTRFAAHRNLIMSVLSKANYYSAECVRDYSLASQNGFRGEFLPCIPNAGGFNLSQRTSRFVPPSMREQILIKGYGGTFGRADLSISLIPVIAEENPNIHFHVYSVTDDVLELLSQMPAKFKSRIRITTIHNRLSHQEMLSEFEKSRIYVGFSESDGISTSFIESLICGAYPIQTNTSCAEEWVKKGAIASVIDLDSELLIREVREVVSDNQFLDHASVRNYKVARENLDYKYIQNLALQFYRASNQTF